MNMFEFTCIKSTVTICQIHIELSGNIAKRLTLDHPIKGVSTT